MFFQCHLCFLPKNCHMCNKTQIFQIIQGTSQSVISFQPFSYIFSQFYLPTLCSGAKYVIQVKNLNSLYVNSSETV